MKRLITVLLILCLIGYGYKLLQMEDLANHDPFAKFDKAADELMQDLCESGLTPEQKEMQKELKIKYKQSLVQEEKIIDLGFKTGFTPAVDNVKGPRHYEKEQAAEKEVKIKFQYLKVGKCYGLSSTLNADILLQQNLSKQEIINFVQHLAHDKDIVILNIFTSKAAYRDVYCETQHSKTDYILSYIKNLTNRRHPKPGVNQISWMQQIGPFSGLPNVQL